MDRGVLDASIFLEGDEWDAMKARNQWTNEGLMARYDLVVHMATRETGYTTDDNPVRTETEEEAKALDDKIAEVWKEHHNYVLVESQDSFEVKVKIAQDSILAAVTKMANRKRMRISTNEAGPSQVAQQAPECVIIPIPAKTTAEARQIVEFVEKSSNVEMKVVSNIFVITSPIV